MKAQISRINPTAGKRYSGLYHLQGGMITDSDLNEAVDIERAQIEFLGDDAVRDGAPAEGGVVGVQVVSTPGGDEDHPFLRPGIVYADGVRGRLVATGKGPYSQSSPLALMAEQADLPSAPAVPQTGRHVVYADIWHRVVHPLEDARLSEVALHGALTGFRTRTMAQLKTGAFDGTGSIANWIGSIPRIGTGRLSVEKLTNAETGNDCDPCATEIPLETRVVNALFRVEVIDVRPSAKKPEQVTLAWSMENAAEVAAVGALPAGFEDGSHAYEHFSLETECHKGVFADPAQRSVPEFADSVKSGAGWDYVRRWDGVCTFDLGAGSAGATTGAGLGEIRNGMPRLRLDFFAVGLDFAGAHAVAGDYWLVELRTNAPHDQTTDERLHVVSETPMGILHHYAPLFRIEDGKPRPLADAERRAVSFPALSDLPASHVAFDNTCPKLYGSGDDAAETVQQALDRLCDIDAGDIKLTKPCPELFPNATTVAEAFEGICNADLGANVDRSWIKHVFDWGVVCGLTVRGREGGAVIEVTPGSYLDWQGRFVTADWTSSTTIKVQRVRLDDSSLTGKSWCLGIEKRDGKTGLVLAHRDAFRLPGEHATLQEAIAACQKQGTITVFDDLFAELDEGRAKLMGQVVGLTLTGAWTSGGLKLSRDDAAAGEDFVGKMADRYAESAGPEDTRRMRKALDAVETQYSLQGLVGTALEVQRASRLANQMGVFVKTSEEVRNACACRAIWPACLDRSKPPMVPLASVGIFDRSGNVISHLDEICMLTCRRQALTPRTMAYYMRQSVEHLVARMVSKPSVPGHPLEELKEICCPETRDDAETPKPGGRPKLPDGAPWKLPDDAVVVGSGRDEIDRKYFAVQDQTLEVAAEILTGNGIEITDVIEVTEDEGLGRLAEITGKTSIDERIRMQERVGPGDSVAVLTEGGTTTGYVVVDRGAGKYAYPVQTRRDAAVVRPGPGGGDVGDGVGKIDQGQIERVDGRVDGLELRIEGLDASLDKAAARVSGIGEIYQALDAEAAKRLEQAGSRFATLQEDTEALAGTLDGLTERRGTLADDLTGTQQVLDSVVERQRTVSAQLQATLSDLSVDDPAGPLAEVKQVIETLAGEFGGLAEGHAGLKTALAGTAETLDGLRAQSDALSGSVDDVLARLDRAAPEARVAQVEGLLAGLEGTLNGLEDRRAALGATASEVSGTLAGLEERMTGLTVSAAGVERAVPELSQQIEGLTAAIAASRTGLTEQTDALARAEAGHSAALDGFAARRDRLDGEISARSDAAANRIDGLQDGLTTFEAALDSSERALKALEDKRETAEEAGQEALSRLTRETEAIEPQIETASAALNRQLGDAQEAMTEVSGAAKQALEAQTGAKRELEALLKGVEQAIAARRREIAGLEEQEQRLGAEIARSRGEIGAATGELSELRKERAQVIRSIRAERPLAAAPGFERKFEGQMNEAGLFTLGDVAALDQRARQALAEKFPETGRFVADWQASVHGFIEAR